MKNALYIIPVITVLVLACNKNQSSVTPSRPAIKTAAVEHKHVSLPVHASGTLTAMTQSKLSFKIGGIIDKISVDEGQEVAAGTKLASLKQDEIQAQVVQARTGFEKARRDLNRVKNLYADSVATLEQLQNMEAALSMAQSTMEIAEFNLMHATITAPTAGRILKRLAEENELIGPGMPALIFGETGKKWLVRAGVPDRDFVRLQLGDSAQVFFDAYPGMIFNGTVTELAGSADPYVGTFEVKVQIQQTKRFVSGFMARIDLYPSNKIKYDLIPVESLIEADQDHGYVFVPQPDNTVKKTAVVIGAVFDARVGILSGLDGIESVVTDGCQYLTDGSQIMIVE